ncbi:CHASE2 domain-containing protein [Parasphingorhabdus sp.]|uniref:CHASE2 domain-containing protein n=1 Tax=Parasphingorhabdus sp. TaxID=2709688 RepID=UPI0030020C2A
MIESIRLGWFGGSTLFSSKFPPLWLSRNIQTIAGLLAIGILAIAQTVPVPLLTSTLNRFGLSIFDSYQRLSPRIYQDAAVRVVDIDDETIRQYGQWPWPRTDLARLTLALGQAGAAAVAFDIVFSEEDRTSPLQLADRFASTDPSIADALRTLPDNDGQFSQVIAAIPTVTGYFLTNEKEGQQAVPKAGIVVSGTTPNSVVDYRNAVLNLPQLEAAAAGSGFLSIRADADSVIRRVPLIARQGKTLLPSLSLDALRVALQAESVVVKTTDGSGENGNPGDLVALQISDIEVPTSYAGELWMHYTKQVPERVVPAWKILSGALTDQEMGRLFGGHIVFIGTGAIGLRDLRSTPMSDAVPGVMIHAEATEQMILKQFLYRPDWAIGLERSLLIIFGAILVLALPRLGAAKGALLGGAAMIAIAAGSFLAFSQYNYLLNPSWPVLAILVAYVLVTVLTYYREERQRAYIHKAFDRYLAPELVKRIADDPSQLNLGGELRPMSVLFCDIRSFSSISENMSPNEIIEFLIAFLTPMTDLMLDRKATIDKYIGDAILAFWNAPLDDPEHHQNAARAALEMVARLKQLNITFQGQDDVPWPDEVSIGIGINSGPCCVGNMGSQQRLSYSLIGDTVNLASRLEGLTKYYGIQIAIGSDLQRHISSFATLEIDRVRVVGRETPEVVSVLLGDDSLAGQSEFVAFQAKHGEMMSAYVAQKWDKAEVCLGWLIDHCAKFGLGKTYAHYTSRIAAFKANPPGENWDGVFTATEK